MAALCCGHFSYTSDKVWIFYMLFPAHVREVILRGRKGFVPTLQHVAFAVLNIMHVAFLATAIGANLVWIIALYSYRVIST